MMSWRILLMAGVLIAGGCGGSNSGGIGAGNGGDELERGGLGCGVVSFPSTALDITALHPFTEDVADYVGDQAGAEFGIVTEFYEIERSDNHLLLFGVLPGSDTGADPYFVARFERDGEWRAVAWGACFLETQLDGYGVAQIELNPSTEVDPASASLSLLATERGCAGGQAPVDRDVRPVVVESDRSIEIVVFVQTPRGAQTCPDNPSFPVEIELASPLGDRSILDTALHPPVKIG